MSSYNRVNGVYANENTHLLQDILYGEWGFNGVVVTDWGGENDRAGLVADNQLEMPSTAGLTDREIVAAVESGELDEAVLNKRVDSLLELAFNVQPALGKGEHFTFEEHHEATRNAARQSVVLLKNEEKLLPLKAGKKVAVIGDFAKTARYQGAGSSLIHPSQLDCAFDERSKEDLEIVGFEAGYKRFGGKSTAKKRGALALAKRPDTVLLFLGLHEGGEAEGVDRFHMRLPENQIELLQAVRETCGKVVVVFSGGAPLVFCAEKELKGFAKVSLQPDEKREVRIEFDEYTFRYYNVKAAAWVEEPGKYKILVGASLRDIRLTYELDLVGENAPVPYGRDALSAYFSAGIKDVSDAAFEKLLGAPLPPRVIDKTAPSGITISSVRDGIKRASAGFYTGL